METKKDIEREEIEKLSLPPWVSISEHRDRAQSEEFIALIRAKKGKEE